MEEGTMGRGVGRGRILSGLRINIWRDRVSGLSGRRRRGGRRGRGGGRCWRGGMRSGGIGMGGGGEGGVGGGGSGEGGRGGISLEWRFCGSEVFGNGRLGIICMHYYCGRRCLHRFRSESCIRGLDKRLDYLTLVRTIKKANIIFNV